MDMNALAQMMGGFGMPPAAVPQPGTSTVPPTSAPAAPTMAPTTTSTTAPTTAPNPWQAPPAYPYPDLAQMMSMFRPPAPMTAPTAPPAPPVDPKVKYAAQLEKMKEMGFLNDDVNLDALKATNGNIEAAIERIITMLK